MRRKINFLLLLFIFISALLNAQTNNPVADPKAIVMNGKARFTVLTDHIIRMEYSPDSIFTDQATLTFINRNLPVPAFTRTEADGWLIIKTQLSTLHYRQNSGVFKADNLYIEYKDQQHTFTWRPGMKDPANLKGTTRTLDGVSGTFNYNGLKKLQLEDGLLSRSGWTLINDSEKPLFDNSDWPWVEARKGNNEQDLYFLGYGSNYKAALYDFTQIAGKISMPPKFAFGIWYSRYFNYSEQDLKDIVANYQANNIPLDVLVVDMDWHLTDQSSPDMFKHLSPKANTWTGFTWEKKYFPDYKRFLAWTDTQCLQTCLNLHPAAGVQAYEEAYPAFAKAMGLDTLSHLAIPFDITQKKFAQNYFDVLLHPYEKAGIDFWWLDWQQWGNTNIKGVNPTFYLNYVHFSDMQRQGKRPLIFHRWGGLGNHRYQIGFSGDVIINWKSLTFQPEFTSTAANVGFGYWSHDIGGHFNPISKKLKQDPELFTRWIQWGAFSPIFRTHGNHDPMIERRMWKYPQTNFNAMRQAIQQRYALVPYIYTMARFAYDSAISLIRPMYYEYPDLDKAYHLPHQYFFGNNMLVAPITKPMHGKDSISQTVWLPAGDWFSYNSNTKITGDRDYTAQYAINEIPVFVKAGSIIPTQTAKLKITGSVLDTLILTVYAAPKAEFNLYEDESTNENYRKNVGSFTRFTYTQDNTGAILNIQPDGKTFTGQVKDRSYLIKIIGYKKPAQIAMNGHILANNEWQYNPQKQVTEISLAKQPVGDVALQIK